MRFLRTALPLVAVATFGLTVLAGVTTAGQNLGWDYQAYASAGNLTLDGAPLYDPAADVAGPRGTYLYPPQFAIAVVPFALLPAEVGLWLWTALMIVSFVAAIAIMPVDRSVRWSMLLLGALAWPVIYTFRLGQVGPLLLLLLAMGWRWLDRPIVLGLTMAAGAMIKVQPLLLILWAALVGRWRAVAIACIVIVVTGAVATIVFGPDVWSDYAMLLGRVSSPVTTPHNFTPGGLALQRGVSEDVASVIQVTSILIILATTLVAITTTSSEVSYLTTATASQLLSPVLWDHYALVLLLPVAWLLQRRQWWAVAIPLLMSIPAILILPSMIYLVLFAIGLFGPIVVDLMDQRTPRGQGSSVQAGIT